MTTTAPEVSTSTHASGGLSVFGDVDSFPSHAELARTLYGTGGIAALATTMTSGHPYGSRAPYSVIDDGSPIICVSSMAVHTKNLCADPRASLLIHGPDEGDVDPLSRPRVSLVGAFVPFEPATQEIAGYIEAHPQAQGYVGYRDFSWWRFEILRARYVGGFGIVGWVDPTDLSAISPDGVATAAAGAITHLNEDHSESCLDIACQLAGVPEASSAVVTALDRLGITLEASGEHGTATARVAFPEPLTEPSQIRPAVVEMAKRAAAS